MTEAFSLLVYVLVLYWSVAYLRDRRLWQLVVVQALSVLSTNDVTGDKPGVVVCEVPAKPQWCEIRTTVFSWTPTRFPFHTSSAKN